MTGEPYWDHADACWRLPMPRRELPRPYDPDDPAEAPPPELRARVPVTA